MMIFLKHWNKKYNNKKNLRGARITPRRFFARSFRVDSPDYSRLNDKAFFTKATKKDSKTTDPPACPAMYFFAKVSEKASNPEQTGIETTTIDYPACFQINSAKNNSRFLAEPAALHAV